MPNLVEENYFSKENNLKYMSASQFKDFLKCPACAMAKLKEEWKQEKTTALMVGSYVDASYEGNLDIFKAKNPEIFKKDGELKSEYKKAEEIINRLEKDKMFSKYMSGEKQVIMTGKILEVPFKIKIDSFHKDKCIVDLKVMKDMQPIWNGKEKENFVEYYGYDIQMAIYQEIVRQNTGKLLPTFLCVATKETITDFAILEIDNERLEFVMNAIIKPSLLSINNIKNENAEAYRCEKCEYCKSTKEIKQIINYKDLNIE
jgi:hypothetical protein